MRALFRVTRDQFIASAEKSVGARLAMCSKRSSAIVYYGKNRRDQLVAFGFVGKADKPAFYYSFRDEQRRQMYAGEFLRSVDQREARRLARHAERKAFRHTLKVGDVLSTCWGYDQTNIEFFQVTKLVGRAMVEVREIAQDKQETGFMTGDCVPVVGKFIGAPRRKRVLEGNVLDIHSAGFGRASPYELKEVAPGVKVGAPQRWSAYA